MPEQTKLQKCHDCGASPGEPHIEGCDVERCSVCGHQRIGCGCKGHDRRFARWTGIWPGKAEAAFLGVSLNDVAGDPDLLAALLIKPPARRR